MEERNACPICLASVGEEEGEGVACDSCGVRACGRRHLLSHRGQGERCLPFRVESDERRGRHFIATRDIKALELVLVDW